MVEIKIEDEILAHMRIIINLLIFSGNHGISLSKLKNTFDNDLNLPIEESKKLFNLLSIDLNENDDKMFIMPQNQIYQEIFRLNLDSYLPKLSEKHRKILVRFLSSYYSQLQPVPVSKHKLKFDIHENMQIDIYEKDLHYIEKMGYITIINNQFIDIGWKLKNTPLLRHFQQNLQKIFADIFDIGTLDHLEPKEPMVNNNEKINS